MFIIICAASILHPVIHMSKPRRGLNDAERPLPPNPGNEPVWNCFSRGAALAFSQ
ncbi:hypothetical protein HMPREF3039_00891 [Akkermansia sp. KLE1798]|nr:hypothetical protein HMPREF3039_00891 [Akkermansia sp. KLE1798]